jgi:hypothetical protein
MKIRFSFWRSLLGVTLLVFLVGLWRLVLVTRHSISLLHSNWTFSWAVPFAGILILFALSWTDKGERWFNSLLSTTTRPAGFQRALGSIAFFVSLPVFPFLVIFPYYAWLAQRVGVFGVLVSNFSTAIGTLSVRSLIFLGSVLFGMICLKIAWRKLSWIAAILITLLANAMVYSLAIDFSQVNNYPFSLGWSEASRYYFASLFFAKEIYHQSVPLPIMHPTWHFLLAFPYLFGKLPIWFHRFWQAGLQLVLTLIIAVVICKRLKLQKRSILVGCSAWIFLFLRTFQIMFSLLPAAIIIILWIKPRKYWHAMAFVLLASIWAGLCRINWFPIPGILAAIIYFLEIPYKGSRSWLGYLWKPAAWVVCGTIMAFLVNSMYNIFTGNNVIGGQFASSLSSHLLWYRLFPNATYYLGILPAAILASIPLLLIMVNALIHHQGTFHPIRSLGILFPGMILFAGGLVVSIKIGGGSNLHNLDGYFIALILVGAYFYFQKWEKERPANLALSHNFLPFFLVVILPIWFLLQKGGPLFNWDREETNQTMDKIRIQTEATSSAGGEVLFVYERQLLALKMVDVPLVPDYEKDYLMEMVMSGNRTYLDKFQSEIRAHRYKLIVIGPQHTTIQSRDRSFSEENNLWVEEISKPLLCYYQLSPEWVEEHDVALYTPRDQPCQ